MKRKNKNQQSIEQPAALEQEQETVIFFSEGKKTKQLAMVTPSLNYFSFMTKYQHENQ
jgi:hypothetical protein